VKRTFVLSLTIALLLIGARQLPAPIQEVPESPTPAPEQFAKPKSKRTIKPAVTSERSQSPTKHKAPPQPQNEAASNLHPFNIPQSQITASATSQQGGNEAMNAIDGNTKTIWHTPWGLFGPEISLPQSITLDLGGTYNVTKLRYLPRQDSGFGSLNGNILSYKIYASRDGSNFAQIATGSYLMITARRVLPSHERKRPISGWKQ
jgi:F5/8 type C domain